MKIRLSPVRTNALLAGKVTGDILTLTWQVIDESNGGEIISTPDAVFDFGPLGEGETLPQSAIDCQWICSDVERIDGEICLTLMLPHGANASYETRFPTAYHAAMMVADGPVPLPPYNQTEVLG